MAIHRSINALFSEQQLEILQKNSGKDEWRKNHIPVARLFFENGGNSLLLTEINEEFPMAFGLFELDKITGIGTSLKKATRKELIIGSIDLIRMQEIAHINNDVLCIDTEFEGKYPLAVYAKVANECGAIVEHEDDDYLKAMFKKYSKGRSADPSQLLDTHKGIQLKNRFTW